MSGRFNLNDYVTVDERIDRFWSDYPHGAIRTEMVYTNNDGSSVAIKASVYKDWEHPQPDATGIAQELQGGANANKSSWWENCETSAIGRALANMGMSISKQRPSREEMAKVQRYQDEADAPRPAPASNGTPAPAANGGTFVKYNDPGHSATYAPQQAVREELAARKAAQPTPAPSGTPAPAAKPAASSQNITDEALLDRIFDDTGLSTPDDRTTALQTFFNAAKDPNDLSARMVTVAKAGLPDQDRKAAYREALARLARRAPAPAAAPAGVVYEARPAYPKRGE